MSMIKKLTALLLLVMICGCLASCVGPDDGQGNIQGEPLPSDKYTAAIRVVYATDDGKMKDAVSAIGTPTVTLFVDGEDGKMKSREELISEAIRAFESILF